MIERAGLRVEHIRIIAAIEIDQATRAQDVHRVFFGVGIQVADDQHVGIVGRCLHGRDERQQRRCLRFAGGIERGLSVVLIGVRAGADAGFGLEVIDDHRELGTGAGAADHAESLRNRRTRLRESGVVRRQRSSDGADRCAAINQRGPNRIRAARNGAPAGRIRDKAPRAATAGRAERVG